MKGVCFWRPILMKDPLKHMPLCVIDPNTIKVEDCVWQELLGIAPEGKIMPNLALKKKDYHRYFYYPDMTKDEVLMLTQFEQFKGVDNTDPDAKVLGNFHTAFKDPNAGEIKEVRTSCEYRVQLFFKNKDQEANGNDTQYQIHFKNSQNPLKGTKVKVISWLQDSMVRVLFLDGKFKNDTFLVPLSNIKKCD